MRPPMNHTATLITTSRTAYGDYTPSTETDVPCHFRHIQQQVITNNESVQCDAMAWFMPDSGVDRKTILRYDGDTYIVERVVKARRLRETAVQFIKCELLRYGSIP